MYTHSMARLLAKVRAEKEKVQLTDASSVEDHTVPLGAFTKAEAYAKAALKEKAKSRANETKEKAKGKVTLVSSVATMIGMLDRLRGRTLPR